MHRRSLIVAAGLIAAAACPAADDDSIEARAARAVLDYGTRIEAATEDLAATRRTIIEQRAPLMDAMRQAEAEAARLEARIATLTVEKARAVEHTRDLRLERTALERTMSYITQMAMDALKAAGAAMLPGEDATAGREIEQMRDRIESAAGADAMMAALDAADALATRLEYQLGGYTTAGSSLRDGDTVVLTGRFAFAGPAVFFRSDSGDLVGVVRQRRDSTYVSTRPVEDWDPAQGEALFQGNAAIIPLDPSGGKGLELLDSRGGLIAEVRKGGVVGYVIVGLGAVAVLLAAMKFADLRRLQLDPSTAMHDVFRCVAAGDTAGARALAVRLQGTTRALVELGLDNLHAPRALLGELLEGFVLRERMVQERRLPLLAVIATAGPLLGLLGTVTGMIKTFTLITVFGTGSAARLSGGISEALVATALGLAVAIPTLLVHGLLSHRIHRKLSLLEQYAFDFATAVEEARAPASVALAAP